MARYEHLPIWRDATRLLILIEEAVRRFPRYHKYALGTDLRRQAQTICRLIVRANNAGQGREALLERLVLAVEDIKLFIQLGKEVRAFASFQEFQQAAELAVALGRQSGGWRRQARTGSIRQTPSAVCLLSALCGRFRAVARRPRTTPGLAGRHRGVPA